MKWTQSLSNREGAFGWRQNRNNFCWVFPIVGIKCILKFQTHSQHTTSFVEMQRNWMRCIDWSTHLSYYFVFYTLINWSNIGMLQRFVFFDRIDCWRLCDCPFTNVNVKSVSDASTSLWSWHLCAYAHTHRTLTAEITVRMFQVPNYYREIVLCVVTCCVYNYLFLHLKIKELKKKLRSKVDTCVEILSCGYLSSSRITDWIECILHRN